MQKDARDRPSIEEVLAARPARVSGVRKCPECGVRLSQYNPGPNCWQHTIGWPWRGPSAKPRF
ncbi:MAG: hypothetical protein E6G40_00455 [Actinobacteria bacterium]|nr:MAG: hypothetical protein E6G40_00455 [Actinomycetota bacterium]